VPDLPSEVNGSAAAVPGAGRKRSWAAGSRRSRSKPKMLPRPPSARGQLRAGAVAPGLAIRTDRGRGPRLGLGCWMCVCGGGDFAMSAQARARPPWLPAPVRARCPQGCRPVLAIRAGQGGGITDGFLLSSPPTVFIFRAVVARSGLPAGHAGSCRQNCRSFCSWLAVVSLFPRFYV
jgi:hypothetical protein